MSARGFVGLLLALAILLSVGALSAEPPSRFGQPLPGLPAPLLSAFEEGRQQVITEETVATGIGPLFHARSCAACHSVPVPAGSGASPDTFTVRFGLQLPGQPFNPLLNVGGPSL